MTTGEVPINVVISHHYRTEWVNDSLNRRIVWVDLHPARRSTSSTRHLQEMKNYGWFSHGTDQALYRSIGEERGVNLESVSH